MRKIHFLLSALIILTLFSCREDSLTETTDTIVPEPTIVVESSVDGLVVDNSDNPIADVNIQIGGKQVTTDESGYFLIRDIQTDQKHTVINATKPGYFNATDVIAVQKQDIARTKIILTEKKLTGTITSQQRNIQDTDGVAIDFSDSGFEYTNGTSYNGDVRVYTTYIDPTLEELSDVMPGDLSAIDANSSVVGLKSFGMIGVVLEDAQGFELQPSSPVEISVPVPQEIIGDAPSTLPLWHFNETTGYWIQEGTAVLEGENYVGLVSHFSFWNCDVPENFVSLSGNVNFNDAPANNVLIQVTQISNSTFGRAFTSSEGYFELKVPRNQPLLFQIFNICGEVVFQQDIEALSTDKHLDRAEIKDVTKVNSISGRVTNCSGDPVDYGYVRIVVEGVRIVTLPLNEQGRFSGSVYYCNSSDATLTAYNLDLFEKGPSYDISLTDNNIDQVLSACGEQISQGVTFDFGAEDVWIPSCTFSTSNEFADTIDLDILTFVFSDDFPARTIQTYTFISWDPTLPPEEAIIGYSYEEQIFDNTPPRFTFNFNNITFNDHLIFNPDVEIGEYWLFDIPATVIENATGVTHETILNISALRIE